jgi:hypothetical protein
VPLQGEERFLFRFLFQPPADLIQERVFLAVDLTTGLVVAAPGFIPPSFTPNSF